MKSKQRALIPAVLALLAIGTIGAADARAQHARGYHHGPVYGRGYSYGRHGYSGARYGYGYSNSYRYVAPRGSYYGGYYGGNYGLRSGYGYSGGYAPYYGAGYSYGPGYGYSSYGGYCR